MQDWYKSEITQLHTSHQISHLISHWVNKEKLFPWYSYYIELQTPTRTAIKQVTFCRLYKGYSTSWLKFTDSCQISSLISSSLNEACSKSKAKRDGQVGSSLISWRLDRYGWFNASSTSLSQKVSERRSSQWRLDNKVNVWWFLYQLYVCMDRKQASSPEDQRLQEPHVGIALKMVALGIWEVAWRSA